MTSIQQVAVLGAGRMGKAIAIAFAYAGLNVALIDARQRSESEFAQYQTQIQTDLKQELQLLESIQFIQSKQTVFILDQIKILSRTAAISVLAHCDLVMEGVPELRQAKEDIFTWLDQYPHLYCRFDHVNLSGHGYCADDFSSRTCGECTLAQSCLSDSTG